MNAVIYYSTFMGLDVVRGCNFHPSSSSSSSTSILFMMMMRVVSDDDGDDDGDVLYISLFLG